MKTFLLLHEFGEIINMLTDNEAGQIIKAVFDYEINSVTPQFTDRTMQIVFFDIKRFLDSNRENYEKVCKRRSESAKKRWDKQQEESSDMQKDAKASKCMQVHAFAGNTNANSNVNSNSSSNYNVNVNSNVSVNDNAYINETEVTQTHKKAYGVFKNVYLTDEEYNLVKNSLTDGERRLESFSAYMKETGKTYNDHYAMLINWSFYGNDKAIAANTVQSQQPKTKQPGERREPTFDISEFTKKALNLKYVPPAEDD